MEKRLFQFGCGEYLPDEMQPAPGGGKGYLPHRGVRYIHVKPGKNGKAMLRRNGEWREAVKELPALYLERAECCGCSACYAVCPMSGPMRSQPEAQEQGRSGENYELTGAITMLPDEEGFLYPVIDAGLCVRCGRCVEVCPMKGTGERKD